MQKNVINLITVILYGLTFAAPVAYIVTLQEMDNFQRLVFSCLALIIIVITFFEVKNPASIQLNKYLLIAMLIFPISFITSFFNGSAVLLPLFLTNLITPVCIVLLTVVMIQIFGEDKFFKVISLSIVLFSGLFGFIGLMEVFEIKVLPLPTIIPPGSTLGHRSFAVEFILPALPFIIILKDFVKKDYYPLILVTAFINISFVLFTRSRSAMLILGIISVFYFIYLFRSNKNRVKRIVPAVSVLLLALVFSMLPAKGAERTDFKEAAESLLDTEFRSNRLRLTYWDASFQLIKKNPVTGVGLFKWSGYYPKFNGEEFNDKTVFFMQSTHAHNDFLELFAENGILTPFIYLLIILIILKLVFYKSKSQHKYFFVLLSVLATVLFSFVAFPLFKFSSHYIISVCAGIALLGKGGDKKKNLKINFSALRIILITFLIIGTVTAFIKLESEFNYIKAINFMSEKSISGMKEELSDVSKLLYPYNPPKQPVDYYRSLVSTSEENYKIALEQSLSAEKLAPYSPVILNNLATAFYNAGKVNQAISQLEELKELFPDYSDPQIKLLIMYASENKEEKGKRLLTELLKKFPENPNLLKIKKEAYSSQE